VVLLMAKKCQRAPAKMKRFLAGELVDNP